jgi:excinuclease ABC subunit A
VIEIDQSPIGRTPRSNPATYTGSFTLIRDWFAGLPEAQARGYKAGRFSFNVKGGRCEVCQGDGLIKIEMHFLPDVYVTCEECNGKRYNRETLEVKFKGHSIADVLDMTIEDAEAFFANVPPIRERMHMLNEVGLGYVKVGQQATTLSGGEAQRVKLAKELARRSTGKTLYVLDEPTTGLHFEDVRKLLEVLHRLVDQGNSVVVIEHNLDVIKTADWIIDMGPEGGVRGGTIVAEGTPEQVAKNKASFTGHYLKPSAETGLIARRRSRNRGRKAARSASRLKRCASSCPAPGQPVGQGGGGHQREGGQRQGLRCRLRHQAGLAMAAEAAVAQCIGANHRAACGHGL